MYPDLRSYPHLKRTSDNINSGKCRICIATEDIVGPVRNGGIGTTYMYLAFLLAEAGYDVTILYLKGNYCEHKTLSYWIKFYKNKNVKFVPLPWLDNVHSGSSRWVDPMFSLYEYLRNNNFDIVHVSEWHGSAYISLLAKRLNLAFKNTIFCVKASSPWLWNREYGLHTIQELSDLLKVNCEKGSIELADIVIGGSYHLLNWMADHDYELPQGNTYVQPNVMLPAEIDYADTRIGQYGEKLDVDELVFFGRLEYRKGLEVFIDSLNIVRQSIKLPKITFLGKPGERIPSYPELSIKDYLSHKMSKIGCEYEIIENYQTKEALKFLLAGKRLAIMPSIIENSSLAVYEAVHFGVPFIASNRGGTPELIDAAHREATLVEPYPVPLGKKIIEKLTQGALIAAPSFDNQSNLEIWREFHANVANELRNVKSIQNPEHDKSKNSKKFTIILYVYNQFNFADRFIKECLRYSSNGYEILIVDDGSDCVDTTTWLMSISCNAVKVVRCEHWGEEKALNFAAAQATGEYLSFVQPGVLFNENFSDFISSAINANHDLYTSFYRDKDGAVKAFFVEHTSYNFFYDNEYLFLLVKKAAFDGVQGFEGLYKVGGAFNNLVARVIANGYSCITIPECLFTYDSEFPAENKANFKAIPFRSIYPIARRLHFDVYTTLLSSKGLANKNTANGFNSALVAANTRQLAQDTAHKLPIRYPMRKFLAKVYSGQLILFEKIITLELFLLRKIFGINTNRGSR